jgi:hypothetical protein
MEQFVLSMNYYTVMIHVQLVCILYCFFFYKNIFIEFHNIDPHLFRRVLMVLESRGQATVFSDNGAEGVKFS